MNKKSELITINESGMKFGPYDPERLFQVEKSKTYERVKTDVKIAEFILLRSPETKPKILILEAKTSFSHPTNPEFDNSIDEIADKFINAFNLFMAMYLKRYDYNELSQTLQNINLEMVQFRLVLVIKNHQKDWVKSLKEGLYKNKKLKALRQIWNLGEKTILVLNEEMARENHLIC